MNKQDLVAVVADTGGLPRARATEVVDAVLGAIEASLKEGREVRLTGFGTFAVSKRKGGTGRNPRTGEAIEVAEVSTVRFKAGVRLKDAVN